MYEYTDKIKEQLTKIIKVNEPVIKEVTELVYGTIKNDKIIHILGTGHSHMMAMELFIRAGGLANVNAILDKNVLTADGAIRSSKLERISGIADVIYEELVVEHGDLFIVISNSGRNAIPLEFALRAKKEGHKVVVLTSLEQSKQYPSRHQSGMKLYEVGDYVLDNCVPSGDGLFNVGGILTGAASSIQGMAILNTITFEAIKKASNDGLKLPIYSSQNVDGYDNDTLYDKYRGRILHM